MDRLKKARAPLRSTLTRLNNQIQPLLVEFQPDIEALEVKLEQLETVWLELNVADIKIKDQLLDDNAGEDEIDTEYIGIEQYKETFIALKNKIKRIVNPRVSPPASEVGSSTCGEKKRSYMLPTIKFMTFNGELKNWLTWWAQFKKVHDDDEIDGADKFQHLLQALEDGTEPKEIVMSYPQSARNYPKAVEALQERYGRDDLQLQFYVRELLTLVISNVTKKEKSPLSTLYLKLESHLRCLDTLKLDEADPATWLFPLVESSLSVETLRAWQRSSLSKVDGSLEDPAKSRLELLMEFIKAEVRTEQQIAMAQSAFQTCETSKKNVKSKYTAQKLGTGEEIATAAGLAVGQICCAFCEGKHETERCIKAQAMSSNEKQQILTTKRLCFRCFQSGHVSRKCTLALKCIICSGKHFPVMCRASEKGGGGRTGEVPSEQKTQKSSLSDSHHAYGNPQALPQQSLQAAANSNPMFPPQPVPAHQWYGYPSTSSSSSNQCSSDVLLNTLQVKVKCETGTITVRLLGDTGSQRSYIRSDIVRKMGCRPVAEEWIQNVLFGGVTTQPTCTPKYAVPVLSLDGTKEGIFQLLVRDQICGQIPKVPNGPWIEELRRNNITLSDSGYECTDIQILIGSDYWGSLLTGRLIKLPSGLVASETMFGWTISGRVPSISANIATVVTSMSATIIDISKMWSLEAIGVSDPIEVQTKEEEEREATCLFKDTVKRDDSGRYIVALPWKAFCLSLPSNRSIAEGRLRRATQSLKNMEKFKKYDDVFRSWEKEEFIAEIEDEENHGYLLPHRPVYKDSTTTPVRPVFDASCKVGKSPSLNDCLYKGPNLLKLIPALLLRFRENEVGVSADIRKAFQMLRVREEDQRYQRFLWWKDETCQQMKIYEHKRVVFGMTCSPFLLAATINSHLQSEEDEAFATRLGGSFYVDNCVTSVHTAEEYVKFKARATMVMKHAGMELREWAHTLEETSLGSHRTDDVANNNQDVCLSVLGLKWNRELDTLSCALLEVSSEGGATKRKALSVVAHLFDPIGFTAPAQVPIKLIVQEACINNAGWDDELPEVLQKKFLSWMKKANLLSDIKLQRHFQMSHAATREVFVFCDASSYAFAAVAFMRSTLGEQVKVQLLLAKSRLAPLSKVAVKKDGESRHYNRPTIPRLELLACLYGTRLATTIRNALDCEGIPFYFWSDSTTALSWIRRHEHWGAFVGNRVEEILQTTSSSQWRHVPGHLNPADFPSRGCNPEELLRSAWWEGPNWLKMDRGSWPSFEETVDEDVVNSEKRKTAVLTVMEVQPPRFSSYRKNIGIWGWVLRFVKKCQPNKYPDQDNSSFLKIGEMRGGERIVLRQIQKEMGWVAGTRIGGMMTIEDENGIIRVQTRLTNRPDGEGFKAPVLLPKQHPMVEQLIMDFHKFYGHGGCQFIMSKLREKFWILQSRRTIKRIISRCVMCRRYQAKRLEVVPGPLPPKRVMNSEPFATTGVDLAGPLFLKNGSKAWIVVFTCAYYRCLHLDLVESLSSLSFLGALERFVSIYGRPNTVYSDNGTNFHGSVSLFKTLDWKEIEEQCNVKQIQWIFNPPTAAWWGGWWERMVRTIKDLLKRVLSKSRLTYDELRTCLSGVCATINDRPLTVVTEDGDDLVPLTPSMFIRRHIDGIMPETASAEGLKLGYQRMKSLQQQLQERFRKEYLSLLVQRANKGPKQEIREGDVVLVGAENKKRYEWPLGLVLELIPGRDGECRVAKVKVSHGVLTRPLQRLYPLEVSSSNEVPKKTEHKLRSEEIAARENPVSGESEKVIVTKRGRVVCKPVRYGQWLHLVKNV